LTDGGFSDLTNTPQKTPPKICVLGAGSWGSTLTWLWANAEKDVTLYTNDEKKALSLSKERRLTKPIEVAIPESVKVTCDLASAARDADIVVFCCTSQSMRTLSEKVFAVLGESRPIIVSAVKGLELGSVKRMSEVLFETLPGLSLCALSGPNLAAEILSGLPAAAVIASSDEQTASTVQSALKAPTFRLYRNQDLVGVELGGTLKNVIAIAAGVSDGLNLGVNARAALITRGLAEMTRLAVKLGGSALTLAGLAGMGDLVASCSGPLSRNYRLGFQLARGKAMAEILADMGAVVEGVTTTEAVCELSKRLKLELPIAEQVECTLKGKNTPQGAIMTLMKRPLVGE